MALDREARVEHETAFLTWSRRHLTTVDLDPFLDADEAVAEPVTTGGADAVVTNLELKISAP